MRSNYITLFVTCLLLGWLSNLACSQALGSFYHGKGPGIVVHDPTTGSFLYNVYANNGFGRMQILSVNTKPKNGTPIACSGYAGPQSIYVSCSMKEDIFNFIVLFRVMTSVADAI